MTDNLLRQRRFLPYFCTQFLGAFNDNIYKNALIIIITYQLLSENAPVLVNVAAGLFILPYFLFSSLAGQLADKLEKSLMIRRIKAAEIGIVLFGCVALYFLSVWMMLMTLFLLGIQSAFFGPIKYSILPQHLHPTELLNGNALVEAGTFLAILLGTIAGGLLASDVKYITLLAVSLILVALGGWLSSLKIPSARATTPNLKINWSALSSSIDLISLARQNKHVFFSILAISWFWFVGSIVLTQFPNFTKTILSGDARVATLLLATFSIGIALGSMSCSKLSGKKVEIGLMPIGAIGISFFLWQLSDVQLAGSDSLRSISQLFSTQGVWQILFHLTMLAFSAGMFIVPLYAFIQTRSDESLRARMFAVNNIVGALFMVMAAVVAGLALHFGFDVLQIFKLTSILNALVTIYILTVVPEFFLRLVGWLLIHSLYRIKKEDLHHIPKEGAALLVCNHVSFADPMIINAVSNRPIRFVMIDDIYRLPVANWLFRLVRAIPIASRKQNSNLVEQAFDLIAKALENGELVCIFPEGGITRDGELAQFKPGIEQIIERTPVPVVPLAIRGLCGTWFSRQGGSAMRGLPIAFMKRLSVVSSEAVAPSSMNCELMYQKVLALRGDDK